MSKLFGIERIWLESKSEAEQHTRFQKWVLKLIKVKVTKVFNVTIGISFNRSVNVRINDTISIGTDTDITYRVVAIIIGKGFLIIPHRPVTNKEIYSLLKENIGFMVGRTIQEENFHRKHYSN